VEIGVRLPATGAGSTPDKIVKVARWAQELGFHSGWIADHIILPNRVDSPYPYAGGQQWPYPSDTPYFDPLLALAWAGAVAPDLKLGTSVVVLPLRHPVVFAKQVATLDRLTGGRLLLGVGTGWMAEEFALCDAPFEHRGGRAQEMVALMRQLWTGENVEFHGAFYQVSGARMHPTPFRQRVPILWGGHTDAALRHVARVGDGWHPSSRTLDQLRHGIGRLRELCTETGRDPDSLIIAPRPSRAYAISAETHAAHLELGVAHVLIDPPTDAPDLEDCRQEMLRVADVCGLQPRS
jgi:probable F420-dependent oxidoreductase